MAKKLKMKDIGLPTAACYGEAVEYGWCYLGSIGDVELWGTVDINSDDLDRWLQAAANAKLPPGTRYEIRQGYPMHYGRGYGRAWYHEPEMAKVTTWGEGTFPRQVPEGGYVLRAQLVTGASDA
jgi:hypothetical protein